MKKKYFHFFCERCEEKSSRLLSSNIPFLSKHVERNCPSDSLKMVYDYGVKLKVKNNTEHYEYSREIELKNYLSRIRRILKDFVNMPSWDYGKDVDNIIEETIKLRIKIVDDLKGIEDENKEDTENKEDMEIKEAS